MQPVGSMYALRGKGCCVENAMITSQRPADVQGALLGVYQLLCVARFLMCISWYVNTHPTYTVLASAEYATGYALLPDAVLQLILMHAASCLCR